MRAPSDTDFFVEVPEIGVFRFGRRTYGDRLKIRSEYLRLTKDLSEAEDVDLSTQAAMVAAHKVLCVESPAGWEDLEQIDLISVPDAEDKVFALFFALKAKEDSFRAGRAQAGQEEREGTT